MGHILTALLGGAAQVGFMKYRKDKKDSAVDTAVFGAMHRCAPSILSVIVDTINHASPRDVGKCLSIIRQLSCGLAIFLLQSPTPEQTEGYCAQLHEHVQSYYPTIDISNTKLVELAAVLSRGMHYRRADNPQRVYLESALLPLNNNEARFRACMYNATLTRQLFHGLMVGLRPALRDKFNFAQFCIVARGYGVEEWRRTELPDPEIFGIQIVLPEDYVEEEYRPTGKRVPLTQFCEPAKTVPDGCTCSICANEVDMEGKGDEASIVTACGHHFHQTCIDAWVNESGMRTANLCPTCRAEMCAGRPRVPASMLDQLEELEAVIEVGEDEVYDEGDREIEFFDLADYSDSASYAGTTSSTGTPSSMATFVWF
jgi:hypothetical protein